MKNNKGEIMNPKAKVRQRRKDARSKDWHRKHVGGEYNYHASPEYHIRKQWYINWDSFDWELEKKHIKFERKLAKHKGIDYD